MNPALDLIENLGYLAADADLRAARLAIESWEAHSLRLQAEKYRTAQEEEMRLSLEKDQTAADAVSGIAA